MAAVPRLFYFYLTFWDKSGKKYYNGNITPKKTKAFCRQFFLSEKKNCFPFFSILHIFVRA